MRASGLRARVALLLGLLLVPGCQGLWSAIRERERLASLRHARELVEQNACAEALESIERAQAAPDLGEFAAESTWQKAYCLDRLGRSEEALAHWRLLAESYPDSQFATRMDEALRRRLPLRSDTRVESAVGKLRIPHPRYSEYAERSGITGEVLVEFSVARDGHVEAIRVLESPHPLLASWAIEAVAGAKLGRNEPPEATLPLRAVSRFRFEARWASDSSTR